MKKLVYVFTICLLIVSCSLEEKQSVITDSELNESALMNKRVIFQDITLEEISSYYGDEQREIFRSLTPENRKRLWKEKFEQLLILTDDEGERLLLNSIYDEVKEMDFSTSLEEDRRERLNDLLYEGISIFDWDEVYVNITFSSFEFYEEGKDDYNIMRVGLEPIGIPNCNCTWAWGCFGVAEFNCKHGTNVCKEFSWSCGWFWSEPCTGRCVES